MGSRALPQLLKVTMAFRIVLLLTLALGYSHGHPAPCSKVDRVLKAANFAAAKHKDQKSDEDETIPFINHPLGVANTLTNIGDINRPEVLQAAILHDIVEYGHATFDDLELGFGKELLLADNLWYLTALDEKEARGVKLTPEETQRFGEVAIEINRYRGANQDIEDMLDKLFAKRKVLLQGVAN